MMYTTNFDEKTMAKAQAISLPISLKQSVEVCKFIRNRKYNQAVRMLEDVQSMKIAVPYSRFNRGGTGHRKGMGPGRYPIKTCGYILRLLKSVHANANQKGLDTSNLIIKAVLAKQGPKVLKYGRKRGRTAKRTHIEIIVVGSKKAAKKTEEEKKKGVVAKTTAETKKIEKNIGGSEQKTTTEKMKKDVNKQLSGNEKKVNDNEIKTNDNNKAVDKK